MSTLRPCWFGGISLLAALYSLLSIPNVQLKSSYPTQKIIVNIRLGTRTAPDEETLRCELGTYRAVPMDDGKGDTRYQSLLAHVRKEAFLRHAQDEAFSCHA